MSIYSRALQRSSAPAPARGPAPRPMGPAAGAFSPAGHDFSQVSIHADSQVAKPRQTTKKASEVCPTCACSEKQTLRLDGMRQEAMDLFDHAAGKLRSSAKDAIPLFEQSFGEGSATRANIGQVLRVLDGAARFLKRSKAGENIHCDSTSSSAGCGGNATAFHEGGHIVVCSGNGSSEKMLDPPQVEDAVREVQTSDGTSQFNVDPAATEEKQKESDEQRDAELTAVLAHEAIHNQIQPGVVDVNRGERLFQFLGKGAKRVDLSPIALKNPDSLVSFAFSFQSSGRGLETSEKLSGALSIRPLLGREDAELAVAMAQEAIEQAEKRIRVLHSEVDSVKGGPSSWQDFAPASQDLAGLLRSSGETALGSPDAAAAKRLAQILEGLSGVRQELVAKETVVARRFVRNKPDERVEIAIPKWREFRGLAPADQIQLLLGELLRRDPRTAGLTGFVWEHARKHGGFKI
ncbi:MAG TPA: hypothetical protein VN493_07690 [Thermoanaerobaculia bacterium]|nr:hypothetical protein [Thermoanaerobaculia bacterium]